MRRSVRGITVLIGLGCVLLIGSVPADAQWPGFRGPNHDGTVPGASLFDGKSAALALGWKRELGSGYSAVAVADGRLVTMFTAGDADVLAAFSVESGDELWRYRIADAYAGHDGSHDGPISTPLLTGGRVFGLGASGHLFAVNAADGKELWVLHLVDDLGSKAPHYGFTTSPLMADGVLVVEIGAEEGKTIAGLSPDDGKVLWTAGNDTIEYHSPIVATFGERRQVVAAGQTNVYGIDAKTGDVLWTYEHAGDERAMGGFTIVPVQAGDDRLFLMNKIDSSVMLSVKSKGKKYEIEELWSNNAIKQSYVTPVYHDGFLYGMSNRIFTCLDAATGETRWRSREPGDGFPTIVGDHLVVITKPGTLHVADASPEGYNELARLDLFDEHSWSEMAYADGHLFARSMAHLARIDPGGAEVESSAPGSWLSRTEFGRFLQEVEGARDKEAVIQAFLGEQESFPIVEDSGIVHFVYRGEAEDVGIIGDMIGFRREDPMTRIDGTDFFHYSMQLEPDAAVTYGFIPDYGEEPVADPNNPRPGSGLFGDVSWFAMPARQAPAFHHEAPASRRGRLETIEWTSEVRKSEGEGEGEDEGEAEDEAEFQERTAQVYLPAGYDTSGDRRYPVLYVNNGQEALDEGLMKNTLDHLIGASVEPLIAVFVVPAGEDPRADMRDMESYSEMIVSELIPKIDDEYRTLDDRMGRGVAGSGRAANVALFGAFQHADVFGRVAGQSATLGPGEIPELERGAAERPMVMYLEWGTYHLRSPHEAWDLTVENRKLWSALREAGYRPAGGEVPEGYGWACWNGHTDEMLAAIFPVRN